MSDVLKTETFHKLTADKGGPEHTYRVTHFMKDEDTPMGKGFVEIEEEVATGDGLSEIKFRRTGADYNGFMEMLKTREAARVARENQDEALRLLEDKRAKEHAAHWAGVKEEEEAAELNPSPAVIGTAGVVTTAPNADPEGDPDDDSEGDDREPDQREPATAHV
jgi:hypothetical protein